MKKNNGVDVLSRIAAVVLCINSLICLYAGIVTLIIISRPSLDYVSTNNYVSIYPYIKNDTSLSREEISYKIEQHINPKLFIKIEDYNLTGCSGKTNMYLRFILIDKDLEGYEYCFTKTHEYVHAKYFYANERLTEFTTFKILYESSDDYLYMTSLYYLQSCTLRQFDYNCTSYILEYLQERGDI